MNRSALTAAAGLAMSAMSLGVAHAQYTTQTLANTLGRPLFATSPSGDFTRLFIVEQRVGTTSTGRISLYKDGALLPTPFLQVFNLSTGDEQGLLGLALHPDYNTNGYFWINYTNSSGTTIIARYRRDPANPDVALAASETVLTYAQPFENHNGGWMAFGPDGYLYIAAGDGGSGNDPGQRAQNIEVLLGKMLRLDVDGLDNIPGTADDDGFPADSARLYQIPPKNPYVGVAGLDEIWHIGLRNPWRNSFDRATGDFWIADVGQDQREEVNRLPANDPNANVGQPGYQGGKNFGWRCREGLRCTGLSGCSICPQSVWTDPLFDYAHSGTPIPPVNVNGCSISGGYVYRGCAIPSLTGLYLFSDYCNGRIFTYDRSSGAVTQILSLGFGVTSFGEDAFGEIYVTLAGSGVNGQLRKISLTTPAGPDCNANGRRDACDILGGFSSDNNNDGIPDDCQCAADFNGDNTLDFFDYLDFAAAFDAEDPDADFNGDNQVDFFDYLDFVEAFDDGCP
jgi:DNA-binding beta-propeller fold protein YncE